MDGLQAIVVFATMSLEEVREVVHRLSEQATLARQKGNQESANTPVSTEEWVDRLELCMGEPDLDQRR